MPVELSLAGDVAELRRRFRAEGFCVPDVYAGIVNDVCGGTRTPESIQAEWDGRSAEYVRHAGRKPPSFGLIDLEYRRMLGNGFMPEAFHQRIDVQKSAEVLRLVREPPALIQRQSQLRDFAEAFAGTRGFSVLRRNAMSSNGRVLRKNATRENGCLGEISIDVGGRFGAVWTSNQMSFCVGNRDAALVGHLHLPAVMEGVVYYGSAQPSYEALSANNHQDSRPPEVVSDLIKLGVMGEIVFFDILLDLLSIQTVDA